MTCRGGGLGAWAMGYTQSLSHASLSLSHCGEKALRRKFTCLKISGGGSGSGGGLFDGGSGVAG